jgi:predicted  nucleic acid-binding Zn-ribbon protein
MTNIDEMPCQRLERLIGVFKEDIKRLKRMIGVADAELAKLQAAPRPHVEKIKAAKEKLANLHARLENAQQGLIETKEDFFENCS